MSNNKVNVKNYDEYIEKEMTNTKTQSYDKLETVGNLKVGDRCRINVEWSKVISKYKARCIGFSKHGNHLFVKVKWIDDYVEKQFGTLFSLDEVIKL